MYTLAGVFILPILILGFFYEIGGKLADKLRIKKINKVSTYYQYGFDAVKSVLEESEIVRTENIKIDLYNKFSSNGLSMGKKDFESLFNDAFNTK